MVKKKSAKEMLVEENEEETKKSVIVLTSSDDDEANEDLSLQIVEKARLRTKRNRDEEDDGIRSVEAVIDLSSSSCEEVRVVSDRSKEAGSSGASMVENKKKKKKKKKKSKKIQEDELVEETKSVGLMGSGETLGTITSVEAEPASFIETDDLIPKAVEEIKSEGIEAVEVSDNIVLRKLLRGPRYFDPPDRNCRSCYNCGEEGHNAVNCTSKKRKKPCFICGSFEHGVRNCTQGQDCFICKKQGHRAKDCPEKHQINAQDTKLCLRCGDLGHLMFSCSRDYDPEDLKEIECYVCKRPGHLCCVDSIDPSTGEVSCYNCGQSGHTGMGCAKHRGEGSGAVQASTSCYKCGEEGHFARGCTNYSKPERWNGESSTPSRKKSKKWKESLGHQSAPPDPSKGRKNKNTQYEEPDFATEGRSKRRGGWIPDDPGDHPYGKAKDNGWRSPKTPVQNSHKRFGNHPPKSQSPWRSTTNHRVPSSHGAAYAAYHGTPTYDSPYSRYPVTPTSHPYQLHPDPRFGYSSGSGNRRNYW